MTLRAALHVERFKIRFLSMYCTKKHIPCHSLKVENQDLSVDTRGNPCVYTAIIIINLLIFYFFSTVKVEMNNCFQVIYLFAVLLMGFLPLGCKAFYIPE